MCPGGVRPWVHPPPSPQPQQRKGKERTGKGERHEDACSGTREHGRRESGIWKVEDGKIDKGGASGPLSANEELILAQAGLGKIH